VQVSAMETTIINETKDWLLEQGVNLDILKGKRSDCSRSKNIILIKNISPKINAEKLEEYFSRYGVLSRFVLSPSNTLGLAEFVENKYALNCMKKLAYYEIEGVPLYLEFAPEGLVSVKSKKQTSEEQKKDESKIDLKQDQGKVVFISNLSFQTKEKNLLKKLKENGFTPVNVKVVTHKKEGSDIELSSGFGFIEMENEELATKLIKTLQGHLIDSHSVKLAIAKTSEKKDNQEETNFLKKKKQRQENEFTDYQFEGDTVNQEKILVKNLAFEANKEELRKLFKTFGEVKSLRLPAKLDGSHRGFAFVEFVSHEEAKAAFKNLQNSHFYGRKLVLEWAQKDKTVDELREETARKVNVINIKTHRTQAKGKREIKDFK
jgi:multiple RNA-binding domain-containing protein 1